ncbi:ESX secretion-associated protein EspG [Amycolatopsis sp. NPDC051071]|uniref:ESX secretion-associated protein EspG n=1 Tax=Amycolatopsis sp. NPDC051071 TaxID=3154637 RepID=UPI00342080C0
MVWFTEPERFAVDQLAVLVTEATGGELHPVLAPQAVWLDDTARAEANRALADTKARYGADPHDPDEPGFTDIAALLSGPPEAAFGWIADTATGANLGVLVAGSVWFRLVAVRDGDDVYVRTFHKDRLTGVLAGVLPAGVGKSTVPSITVLRSELRALSREVAGAVTPGADVRRAQRFAALEPWVIAELYAETRKSDGNRVVSDPLRVYDTDEGRWIVTTAKHYDDERLTLIPATERDVAAALERLRDTLSS